MEAKYQEITLGETVCRKLKHIYFKDIPWSECYRDVARKFSELKLIVNKFYVDKNNNQALIELSKYSNQDIIDAFEANNHAKDKGFSNMASMGQG